MLFTFHALVHRLPTKQTFDAVLLTTRDLQIDCRAGTCLQSIHHRNSGNKHTYMCNSVAALEKQTASTVLLAIGAQVHEM